MTQEIMLNNERFNAELQMQIEGRLDAGHVFNLGKPGAVLKSTGFPDDYIELAASHLSYKSQQYHHPYEIGDVKDLVKAINDPIAVFVYGEVGKAQNVITEIEREGKKFVVGVHFNQSRRGSVVSDIRGLYNKDNAEWLNWISQGKLLYVNKEKIQNLIDKQQRTLTEVTYLDLDFVAKIIKNFENPKFLNEKSRITDLKVIRRQDNDYWMKCRIDGKPMPMERIRPRDLMDLIDGKTTKESLAVRYYARQLALVEKKDTGLKR